MTAARVRITDLIDADAGSPRYCGHSIGRVIQTERDGSPVWVKVDRIERSGPNVYGCGPVIGAAQAEKLQTRWDIRWGLRVAPAVPVAAAIPTGPARLAKFSDIDGAAAAIVAAGYRELAKRHHPDAGGSHAAMSLLTQAKQQLVKILDLAKGNAS
jgi:hypothetical protein